MHIDHEILVQNQIDALDNNQVSFILYQPGSGGEFLSYLVSKYSSNNYFKLVRIRNENNMHKIITFFMCSYFMFAGQGLDLMTLRRLGLNNGNKLIKDNFITVESVLIARERMLKTYKLVFKKGKILELDTHLNNKGRIIIPSHFIFTKYMNLSNTFYITVDEFKYLNYIKDLSFIKLNRDDKYFAYGKKVENSATPILMSQMFKKGYLEEMFNIEGNEFHKELISWHRENVRLVNEYRKGKNYEEKGISIPTL